MDPFPAFTLRSSAALLIWVEIEPLAIVEMSKIRFHLCVLNVYALFCFNEDFVRHSAERTRSTGGDIFEQVGGETDYMEEEQFTLNDKRKDTRKWQCSSKKEQVKEATASGQEPSLSDTVQELVRLCRDVTIEGTLHALTQT